MNRLRMGLVTLLLMAAISVPAVATAQPIPRPGAPAAPQAPATQPLPRPPAPAPVEPLLQPSPEFGDAVFGRSVVRVGQDYTLGAGDAVRDVTVIFGSATIGGRVEGDLVVVLGKATLSATAVVDGSFVVVGGSAVVAPGAKVDGDLVVVGGGFDAPAGFTPGREHIVIGPAAIGGQLDTVVPWITRGLLWGRPIVPDLAWVWWIVGLFFLVYLALNLVFDRPVQACAVTLSQKPLTTFMVGLLVLLLAGPVCFLLAVSVIGIAVVPFVLCALVVGGIVGKVGTARWIGMSVVGADAQDNRLQAFVAFAIGFGAIVVAYMIPVMGFVVFALLGVLGLGAAALAFITAYRRENPAPPPRVRPAEFRQAAWTATAAASVADAGAVLPGSESPENHQAPIAPATPSDLAAYPRAAFRDRLAAFVLDIILVVFVYQILDVFRQDNAIFLLLLAYHIGFWTWKGSTVGGIICQLRVVRVDGARLTFADALVRGLASIFSLVVLGIGCLWMLRDPERQTWHDRIAGTYVVKVPRNFPL